VAREEREESAGLGGGVTVTAAENAGTRGEGGEVRTREETTTRGVQGPAGA